MKRIVNIARIIVGALFVFSGLVKAIDPLGLAYKMQEFFEAWGNDGYMKGLMDSLYNYALIFSITMIALEIVLGIALLLGWRKNIVSWLLLLLITFFTFLTSYVLFTGKIRACGCFGDCIPLTPVQTFTKDLILLALIILILFNRKYIEPVFKNAWGGFIVLLSLAAVMFLQFYVLKHLPIKDCLPYKKGNNILELRKMPADAVQDKYEYRFTYEKNGVKKEFTTDSLPDGSWTFKDRQQILVEKGKNNIPLINDFSLKRDNEIFVYEKDSVSSEFEANALPDSSWQFVEKKTVSADSTEAILSQFGEYYLFFVKALENTTYWSTQFADLIQKAKQQNRNIYIVTSEKDKAEEFFNQLNQYNIPVYSCDGIAIKTAARANPTLFLMKGPVVQDKWSWADMADALK